ncbi:vif protein [Simian immunodeficiency virus]|uniref:Virion infectivity factor n=1 Tax=Simian immunodeficiency virus (isolate GB1) TaxID=11732 RepID=VIF_SIVGB|nr:RecName: Full=Virion infectivity factor; Short=Vif; AltName: Full=Q protein; AltName: Full=SOR protein [Simian immunodeficiency virus (ISOLATE GB1)]pir/S28082/ vif protein - simian immunodeficiency virus [Simian immunodeficiency virus]AAB49570.1 vif protein [Simian immunodeficiency virus]
MERVERIVRLTWKVSSQRIEKWHWLVRRQMAWATANNEEGCWWLYPHFMAYNEWYTCSKVVIIINRDIRLIVRSYWHLQIEVGCLSTYAVSIEAVVRPPPFEKEWCTEITPEVADHLIHLHFYDCFMDSAVMKAIRGEEVLKVCRFPAGHKAQGVLSLQFLCLRVIYGPEER